MRVSEVYREERQSESERWRNTIRASEVNKG